MFYIQFILLFSKFCQKHSSCCAN